MRANFQLPGVGVTKSLSVDCGRKENFGSCDITSYSIGITFIFDMCHSRRATVRPDTYGCDVQYVTSVLMIINNWENTGMDEIGFVTPTPGDQKQKSQKIRGWREQKFKDHQHDKSRS